MLKTSRIRPNPTWGILRRGLKTIWGKFQTAAIYIYIYMCVCVCVCVYIYIYKSKSQELFNFKQPIHLIAPFFRNNIYIYIYIYTSLCVCVHIYINILFIGYEVRLKDLSLTHKEQPALNMPHRFTTSNLNQRFKVNSGKILVPHQ